MIVIPTGECTWVMAYRNAVKTGLLWVCSQTETCMSCLRIGAVVITLRAMTANAALAASSTAIAIQKRMSRGPE